LLHSHPRVIICGISKNPPLRWPVKRQWVFLDSKTVYQNRIVRIREDTYHFLPNDIVRDFTVFDFGDWVNIIPLTPEGKVVMIRQYRLGARRETLEIPGGLISEEDLDPGEAALREMIEETGYHSDDIVHIGTVQPNPAIQSNRCFTYLARNAVPSSAQSLDPTEDIVVELVDKDDVCRMISTHAITHGLVVAAFAHLMIFEALSKP
jgi:8-oxo-dGTP pyrophosphatase MutT (NUDIX family)